MEEDLWYIELLGEFGCIRQTHVRNQTAWWRTHLFHELLDRFFKHVTRFKERYHEPIESSRSTFSCPSGQTSFLIRKLHMHMLMGKPDSMARLRTFLNLPAL
ncbi:unnamed protein product [Microthlaspi erraticum]|uniref:Uncharacterized protein n=1 Tax=Microthlaspi erraticum TaxID=1685480 RepID=A0A6D2KSX8_9BRAS|nr:unnamed protein product [Microthlaspi erraticum]